VNLNLFTFITDLSRIPILVDKEGWHKASENRVNHLFADGHVESHKRFDPKKMAVTYDGITVPPYNGYE
jgi:prepilin-type processing-associated H-X9-DG protein